MPLKSPKKKKCIWLSDYEKTQSPINLSSRFAYQVNLPLLKLEKFGKIRNLKIRNTGTSVGVEFDGICPCFRPKLSGGGFTSVFTLENIHFHWPSEHFIDGIQYDIEAHFVFFNEKYKSFKEAVKHPLAITVMAVLFVQTTSTRTKNFPLIAEATKKVWNRPNQSVILKKDLDFFQFLPYDHDDFFKYIGSLTTKPPGQRWTEYVNWIVLKNTANIGLLDLRNITHITNKHGELVSKNNRELQDLNERNVYTRLLVS